MIINKELLKGTIPFMVLCLIAKKDLYGYQIIKCLNTLSSGVFVFKEGTLYPILHSLEKDKSISSYWQDSSVGRKRKYYSIKDEGKKLVIHKQNEWNVFQEAVESVLTKEVPNDED